MLARGKSLYQVKLILDCLPIEEYKLIPKETIDYIEKNFEFDSNIVIDPSIPLEKQNIDDSTYNFLEKILKQIDEDKANNLENKHPSRQMAQSDNSDVNLENIRLKDLVERLRIENDKIPKAKEIIVQYQQLLEEKDNEIKKLKENNQQLYKIIQRTPKIIKRLFLRDFNSNLLIKGGNE